MSDIAKAGTLMKVTQGCWSDYHVIGLFEVQRDFSPSDELERYLDANPDSRGEFTFDYLSYVKKLTNDGLIMPLEHATMHVGNYGDIRDFGFRENTTGEWE